MRRKDREKERNSVEIYFIYVLCIYKRRADRFAGENAFSIGHRPYLHNKLPVVSIYYAIVDYSSRILVGERAHTMHKYLTWYFKTSGWTWCVYRSLSSSHSRSVFQPSFLSLASSLSISPPNSIRTQLHSFAHKIYRVSLRERFHHFKVCVCSIFLRGGKFMDNALAHNNFKCVYNEHFGRAMLTLGFVQF